MKRIIAVAFIGLFLFFSIVNATTITLNFDALPSTQGWTYNSNIAETTVFSVNGDSLLMDTNGYFGNHSRYEIYEGIDFDNPFTISMTAKVIDYQYGSWPGNQFAFSFGVYTGSEGYGFGLDKSGIQFVDNAFLGSNVNTGINTFRAEIDPVNHWYQLFVNDVIFFEGAPRVHTAGPVLYFGDSTGGPTANAEIMSFTVNQPAVPEPTTILLVGAGLIGLAGARRKMKS